MNNIDIHKIKEGDLDAFKTFFEYYYPRLMAIACRFVNQQAAEDLVQDLFTNTWYKKEGLEVTNLSAFLYRSIQNRCLNYLKHQTVVEGYNEVEFAKARITFFENSRVDNYAEKNLSTQDVRDLIEKHLTDVPARSAEAFRLAFFQDLPHKEIAIRMDISVRTVETHIYKVINNLRKKIDQSVLLSILLTISLLD